MNFMPLFVKKNDGVLEHHVIFFYPENGFLHICIFKAAPSFMDTACELLKSAFEKVKIQ